MKIKYLLAAAALAMPALLFAKPADPRVRTMTNPDGTEVQVRVIGDEHFHFMTDVNRTRIIERDNRGFYTDAMRDGKVLLFNDETISLLREETEAGMPEYTGNGATGPLKMATLDSEGRSTYPTIGEGNRSLVVLVEFDDVEFTVENPQEYYTRQLNEPGFSDYWGKGSALDYYKDISNGMYVPQFDVYGPVKVPYEAKYFSDLDSHRMYYLIKSALTQLHDAGDIDFSNYDLDNNGIVDTVFIYYAGYGQADSDTETIWPHQYDFNVFVQYDGKPVLKFDGKRIGPYACGNELSGFNPQTRRQPWKDGSEPWVDGIGTFVHEYGHVLGLPDLYDVSYSGTQTPGDWDVMASGCYNGNGCVPPRYSAYEQWLCKWLEYEDPEDATHYEIPALGTEGARALRLSVPKTLGSNATEYFLIEARDKSGWDSCFDTGGVMIWHINYEKSVWNSNSVNTGSSHVSIHYANGENHPLFTSGNIFPGGDKELKATNKYSKWESPFITSIGYDENARTGYFDYNVIEDMPTGAPVLHDQPVADADGKRAFTLEWDALEGADSYQLTVQRTSDGIFMDDYNEKNVGNVCSFKVDNVALSYWIKELRVYVRAVVNGFPSRDISNELKFIPRELPKDENAVEAIGGDNIVVAGAHGYVVAPDNARIFDISGREVENSNLPAGIYIVSVGAKSVKVVVR